METLPGVDQIDRPQGPAASLGELVSGDLTALPGIAQQHGVVLLVLFGSTARGRHRPGSDLDLAVLFADDPTDEESWQRENALLSDLEEALLPDCELQLVTLNTASETLCKEVADHGIPLYADTAERWVCYRIAANRGYERAARFRQRSWDAVRRNNGLVTDETSPSSKTHAA